MTNASTGWGGEFWFDNNSGALTELVEVVSFTLPNGQTEQLDATHLKSPGRRREKVAGMIDDGDLTVVINYIPGEATDLLLSQAHTEGDTRSCDAFVSGYDRGEIVADGIKQATVTFTLSGAATEGS